MSTKDSLGEVTFGIHPKIWPMAAFVVINRRRGKGDSVT